MQIHMSTYTSTYTGMTNRTLAAGVGVQERPVLPERPPAPGQGLQLLPREGQPSPQTPAQGRHRAGRLCRRGSSSVSRARRLPTGCGPGYAGRGAATAAARHAECTGRAPMSRVQGGQASARAPPRPAAGGGRHSRHALLFPHVEPASVERCVGKGPPPRPVLAPHGTRVAVPRCLSTCKRQDARAPRQHCKRKDTRASRCCEVYYSLLQQGPAPLSRSRARLRKQRARRMRCLWPAGPGTHFL